MFFSLSMWLAGGMLYVWIISLIVYRSLFFPMDPEHLTPPYWINMGAMAICTLAALVWRRTRPTPPAESGSSVPSWEASRLLAWSTATFWIPMLLVLGVWRHVIEGFPLRYDPGYWGAVFPLGMYTACTARLAGALRLPFLMMVPRTVVYLALAAWLLASPGLVLSLITPPARPPPALYLMG